MGADIPATIEEALGDDYKPEEFQYVLVRHGGVAEKLAQGFHRVGVVADRTANDTGTLVVMEGPK